jgi:hypothetical protein
VTYIALDWHQLDKELGSEKLVEAFWSTLSAVAPAQASPDAPHPWQKRNPAFHPPVGLPLLQLSLWGRVRGARPAAPRF